MLDNAPPPSGHSPTGILIEVATMGFGLLIAVGLKLALDAWLRRRNRKNPNPPTLP